MRPHPRPGSAPRIILCGALFAAVGLPAATVAGPAPAVAQPAPAVAQPEPGNVGQPAYQAHQQLVPLGAEQAWRHSTGAGVTVAVIDSGVDPDHPDLAGRVLPGADFVDGSTDGRRDPVGHGTTVASLVAGRGGGTAIGMAPDATVLPVRVLDNENRYQSASTVADGVVWAVEHGADVINLSLGGDQHSTVLSSALEFAMANDVVVIACTGNVHEDPDAQVWYPAREPGVVAVSGVAWSGDSLTGWSESLTGRETVLAAPAQVLGADAGGGHRPVQGTSFSSAMVAGAAALVRAQWPRMSAGNVVNRLLATAEDLGASGRDPETGFGAFDPVAALTAAVPPAPTNPLDTKPREGTAGLGHAAGQEPEVATTVPEPDPGTASVADLATAADLAGGHATPSGSPAAAGPAGGWRALPGLAWGVLGGVAVLSVGTAAAAAGRLRRPRP